MLSWLWYIVLATVAGSLSVVLAKAGLREASEYPALVIRTGILFLVTVAITIRSGQLGDIFNLNKHSLLIITATGISTSVYWIFYYKALKLADAHKVAALDKAGIILTVVLSSLLLKEPASIKTALGIVIILAGCLLIISE